MNGCTFSIHNDSIHAQVRLSISAATPLHWQLGCQVILDLSSRKGSLKMMTIEFRSFIFQSFLAQIGKKGGWMSEPGTMTFIGHFIQRHLLSQLASRLAMELSDTSGDTVSEECLSRSCEASSLHRSLPLSVEKEDCWTPAHVSRWCFDYQILNCSH